jgi:hypothetical protein
MSFRSKLVGTWRLMSLDMVDSNDKPLAQPFGEHPKGSLMYSSDGYMSSHVANPVAKPWNKWNEPSVEEAVTAAKLINGYTGKFSLNEVPGHKQTVFHEIRIAMPPNLEGGTQKRHVEMSGEDGNLRMTIRTDNAVDWFGQKAWLFLKWKKEDLNEARTPSAEVEDLGAR